MYRILGGDGKEYGPVSVATLQQWLNEGRANRNTQVRPEGSDRWQSLASLPEFSPHFAPPPAGLNPPVSGVPIGSAPNSNLAIVSLVLGVCGFMCPVVTALPGLIVGLVAMKKIKASEGRLGGRGLALAGVIVSAVALVMSIVLIAIYAALLLPALAKAKSKAQTINCVNNVRQLALATIIYADSNNETLPQGTNWCDATFSYVGNARPFQCPDDPAQLRSGFAFNAALSGLSVAHIAPDTVLFFESDGGWNASGGKELMIAQPRHNNTFVIGLADGSVQQVRAAQLGQLRWNPTNETNHAQE